MLKRTNNFANLHAMKALFTLLFSVVVLLAQSQTQNISAENEAVEYIDLFNTGMKAGVSCFRIPSIVTAPNGNLIAVLDERVPSCGDLKWNKNINIVMRRSTDHGESWSEIETIVDYPEGESASDPSMIVDNVTGTVFLFYNYMDLENERDVYYLKVMKSVDNGLTWSAPIDITSQIAKPEWHNDAKFVTSGNGIQTRNGRLLHTMVNLDHGLHLFGSDDHGESWYVFDTPITPGDESKIVELADGTWMINSRINGGGIRYVHTSNDEGATWTSRPDSSLIDPGCNACIMRYSSVNNGADRNRLLFSNAKMKDQRMNMTVRISYDEGKSWTAGKTIYSGSAAYSSMCVLENGDIGLFFEKDNYQKNVFVRVTLPWLSDGKDRLKVPSFD